VTIALQLEHVGEPLVSQMLKTSKQARQTLLARDLATAEEVCCELPLSEWNARQFDGAHRIDVAILDRTQLKCEAVELKLGHARMTSGAFNIRFLSGTSSSHGNRRVKGSMVSILERLSTDSSNQPIEARSNGRRYIVQRNWTLVIRKRVFEKWQQATTPQLSRSCRIVLFEDVVESYRGEKTFNKLVSELIRGDYYQEWLCS
jgi:hypothetical protein